MAHKSGSNRKFPEAKTVPTMSKTTTAAKTFPTNVSAGTRCSFAGAHMCTPIINVLGRTNETSLRSLVVTGDMLQVFTAGTRLQNIRLEWAQPQGEKRISVEN